MVSGQGHPMRFRKRPGEEAKALSSASEGRLQGAGVLGLRRGFCYLFQSGGTSSNHLVARWLFLRALGLIYFSAFFALLFQIRGLIGSHGVLPAAGYLQTLQRVGSLRFWYAPSLLWLDRSDGALAALCWTGAVASLLVVLNLLPRAALLGCFGCFLSFVAVSQDFGQYQSDGMLLEAGFLALFLAPAGFRPGLGRQSLPIRAALYLLLWEWFRIYFESGVVKIQSGDPTWRNLTAMYEYYQNGPLPTWVGWYLQHLPHWFHIGTAGATMGMELLVVWLAFAPGRWRVFCFAVVTVWQAGVILTANYAFLNYLVLALGFLLLEDRYLLRFVPSRWHVRLREREQAVVVQGGADHQRKSASGRVPGAVPAAIALSLVGYVTAAEFVEMFWPRAPLPSAPIGLLEPFRIANTYGLFATMTPHRYEIEFQGSMDGRVWQAYRFRYKPQDPGERPRIYAPYQPRFDWNLWFASLGSWEQAPIVPLTEERLLEGNRDVVELFRGDPFPGQPPRYVRAVLWQYWFSTPEAKRTDGVWWRRELLGTFAPTLEKLPDGRFGEVAAPQLGGPPPE